MGFNKRKMEDQRRYLAEKEAKARRTTEILEDAAWSYAALVVLWNERQTKGGLRRNARSWLDSEKAFPQYLSIRRSRNI
jgi:hypothetical protein